MDELPPNPPQADLPSEPTKARWWEFILRIRRQAKQEAVALYAAGVTFYLLLALVPMLAAVAAIYGLAVDRDTVVEHVALLDGMVPQEIVQFVETELGSLASAEASAGWALVLSLGLAVWGSSKAVEALAIALNRLDVDEVPRRFLRMKLKSIAIAVGLLVFFSILMLLLVAVPAATAFAGLSDGSGKLMTLLRWPLLFVVALLTVTALYRFAPCQPPAKWRWIAPGSLVAATSWVLISLVMTFYTSEIGWASKTYGSLAVVVLLMFFFYLSAIAFLIGGVINSEVERRSGGQ